MTDRIFDLTSEPWCWHPDQITTLTDYQIEMIRSEQTKRVERHMPKGPVERERPMNETTKADEPFIRSGRSWEYALQECGGDADKAEALLRAAMRG